MSKSVKIWLIIAASLTLIGAIIFSGIMMALNWDFSKISTVKYETNGYEFNDAVCKNIKVITDTADISFVPSAYLKVVCYEETKAKHLVTLQGDTLIIEAKNKKWYDHIGINFGSPKITVYIPSGEYGALSVNGDTSDTEIPKEFKFESIDISQSTGDVKCLASASGDIKIKTSTGDIKVENITAASLNLTVSTGNINATKIECIGDLSVKVTTGKVKLENIRCSNLISTGDTGDITLTNVITDKSIDIERTTGDVKFDGCDAGELIIITDTGNVKGTLLSEKVFITKTDTGSIKVPETVSGGKCKVTTDTGDIKIEIKK
jgi:formylmethanofuran dehydrogenase subunit D